MPQLPKHYVPMRLRPKPKEENPKAGQVSYGVGYSHHGDTESVGMVFGPVAEITECLDFVPDVPRRHVAIIYKFTEPDFIGDAGINDPVYEWERLCDRWSRVGGEE